MKQIKLSKYVSIDTNSSSGYWFGYYNYDTLNYDQTKMLAQYVQHDAEVIKKGMIIDIGYFNNAGDFFKLGESDSYSWPQGSMVQWLNSSSQDERIIYNLSKDGRLISKIIDLKTKEQKDIDWSIYGLTPDGKKSIALDMERSYWCRAYHYESVANPEKEGKIAKGDGIFEIDLEKNTRKLLIPIEKIINVDKEAYFDEAKHWLEHIMVSPNGKRFCFLHRFTIGNLNDYETRLFIADIDGSNLQIIDGWRKFSWSHFGWNTDDTFAIYAYELKCRKIQLKQSSNIGQNINTKACVKNIVKALMPKTILRFAKSMFKYQKTYYQYYSIVDGKFKLKENFNYPIFSIDGHPSFTNDGRYMITDTYPDDNQYQHLIVFDTITHKGIVVAKIYAALHLKPGSCDLHPKLCKDNSIVVVDTAFDGKHHMLKLRLDWNLIKNKIS